MFSQLPTELIDQTALIGPPGRIKERLAALREAGVSALNLSPLRPGAPATVKEIELLTDLIRNL